MKKKLFIFSILLLAILGCNSGHHPKDVLPTSIIVSPTSLDLKVSETNDLNNLLSFNFEPIDVTNKNVVFSAESPYFSVIDTTITTFEYSGTGTLKVTSVADENVFTNVTINVIEDEPIETKYHVTYNDDESFSILGLKEEGYLENEEVSFTIQVNDEEKEIDSVTASEIELTPNENTYSFNMPNHDVAINVTLKDIEIIPPEPTSSIYDIIYDMGSRKTSYAFKEGEESAIKDCFVTKDDSIDVISSVSSFSYIYGGGYGGSGENAWLTGNVLKFGTTSANSALTLELTKAIKKVEVTGMVSAKTAKVEINGVEITCSDMALAGKETVDNNSYTSFEVEIDDATSLTIATTNKKVLYIKSIELFYGEDKPIITEKYTVTWKNYDGSILKTDTDVLAGTIPQYNEETPTKPSDDNYNYVFSGWNPKPAPISEDTVYTATFTAVDKDAKISGGVPLISTDNKTIEYGIYPQTHISDISLIETLNSLTLDANNYVLYNNEYYVKVTSNIYNNETYTFDDGAAVINATEYWFKCETIKWNIIQNEDNKYTLMSNLLLDAHNFYNDYLNRTIEGNIVYPNNYQESAVRAYLNNEFLNKAFFLGSDAIINAQIDSLSDKIYLPSKDEVSSLEVKTAKTTDYSRSIGAFASKDSSYKHNGSYWTRTSSDSFTYAVWNVNAGGVLSEYAVDGTSHSIRPCIQISL